MTLDYYQSAASKYMQPQCNNKEYLALGLCGEAGEVADKIKRIIRGDGKIDDDLLYEIGDTLWYISQLADFFCVDMSKLAQMNLDKLQSRLDRDRIKGTGDKR
ncbi:MAG: nucleoside triphosphate pyrophosphohydrolase family protein [Desulfamplus sp.]|nr:nucleoside triphosphate pyrophosphohydrolase family protein [Desulfamplus sp.]